MRMTVHIDDDLLERASELTCVADKASLVRLGLEVLIAQESAKRLAILGGTENGLCVSPRRRPTR